MRWLFYATTPLQLYLASRIALTELNDEDSADIVVCELFPRAKNITEQLVAEGIFTDAFFCQPTGSIVKSAIIMLSAIFDTRTHRDVYPLTKTYDRIAIPTVMALTSSLIIQLMRKNPDLKVIFFEDGACSYNGTVFNSILYGGGKLPNELPDFSPLNKIARLFIRFFRLNALSYTPSALFLRNPAAFALDPPTSLFEIGGEKEIDRIANCFSEKDIHIPEKGIIFLEPPRKPTEYLQDIAVFDELISECSKIGIRYYIREHPRSTWHGPHYDQSKDISGGLWESICTDESVFNSCLVGLGSTAQLTPFLESNIKAPLLFVHRLVIDESDRTFDVYESTVNIAKELYGEDASKLICNASTKNEAINFLMRYCNDDLI